MGTRMHFEDGGIYHIFNRGTDKRTVFMDDGDYLRFVHHLYEFNDAHELHNLGRLLSRGKLPTSPLTDRDPMVRVLAFTLMPNHYHLLLQQVREGGISKFMQKVGTGYTMFFNEKYTRTGVLFQGKFKAVAIESVRQLRYVIQYIHLNPFALSTHLPSHTKRIEHVRTYRWSSLPDYIGDRAFPSVTERASMLEEFGGMREYEKDLWDTLHQKTLPQEITPRHLLDS